MGLVNLHRVAIKIRVDKQFGGLFEIDDGEEVLVVIFVDARATANDLLELGHRLDALIQHDELAGLGIHARGHQFGGGRDDRVL